MSDSVSTPLLDTIEPDDVDVPAPLSGRIPTTPRTPVVLNPGARPAQEPAASAPADAEAGMYIPTLLPRMNQVEIDDFIWNQVSRAYSDKYAGICCRDQAGLINQAHSYYP